MNPNILIIEDELETCDYLREFFVHKEIEVTTANTGEMGLELFESKRPALVLLDLKLGSGMTGVEVLRRMKGEHPEARVIVVTAVNDPNTRRMAEGLGADAYVTKPFRTEELEQIVLDHLQEGA